MPVIRKGGGCVYLNDLVQSQVFENCEHHCIATTTIDENFIPGCNYFEINYNTIIGFFRTAILILRGNYDLIHIHGRHGGLVCIFLKLLGKKVVLQFHGYYGLDVPRSSLLNALNKIFDKLILKTADCVIATCKAEQKKIENLYKFSKTCVVLTRRSLSTDLPRRESDDVILNKKKIYCLSVEGVHQKGIDSFLDLCEQCKDLEIEFIHYFNHKNLIELQYIQEQINTKELNNYYLRESCDKIWHDIYADAYAIISTSRFEGRNMTLQESFWNGVLVIASNCTGQDELLNDRWSMILDINDITSWKNVIEKATELSQAEKYKLEANAFNFISEFGDQNVMHREILNIYDQILDLKP